MDTIFIIEDDQSLRDELTRLLELQRYEVVTTLDFKNAVSEVLQAKPSCVVLDLALPEADGHAICRDIRLESNVPIIVLTSSVSEFDEVMALGLGADDFITKPYRPAVLLARIQAVLRKSGSPADAHIEYGGVTLDSARGVAHVGETTIELTKNEMRILRLLMENGDKITARQDIMCQLWESDEFIDDNTLTVNVNRLRKALCDGGAPEDYIKTHRGIGYSL